MSIRIKTNSVFCCLFVCFVFVFVFVFFFYCLFSISWSWYFDVCQFSRWFTFGRIHKSMGPRKTIQWGG